MANKKETTDPADKVNALAEEEENEDIIDLTEIVDGPDEDDDDVIELTDIVKEDVDETARASDMAAAATPPSTAAAAVPVSREQVEAAVEKVIREIYAEKIETMLFDVINTVVKDEIDRLKEILEQEVQPDD